MVIIARAFFFVRTVLVRIELVDSGEVKLVD